MGKENGDTTENMMGKRPKVIAVMPAYNASTTLEATVRDIPPGSVDEIILVDDASRDNTVALAKSLGLTVIAHNRNRGYGANQKTCYDEALKRNPDIVIMIHPDYQYDSRLVPHINGFLESGVCDIVLGNRIRTRREALASGMPGYKYISNRLMTIVENMLTSQNLGEWHSGYRAYTAKVLRTIPYHNNSDDFVFDTQFLVQAVYFGFRIGDVPVPVRYMAEASSVNFRRSVTYGLCSMVTILKYVFAQAGLIRPRIFQLKGDTK